ncbi:MAG: D-alanyl-D-alanine carboxypeptidase/D-alanyl-D-alanine-endopeptidase [Gammaproteobacteria bacterium RIFCSPLOWO2_12_FULL_38_14]|nr:MAG: D-alanyl-D-alanine carboxypeptidase/D-alanyl-D-alanine-endopeptidase [Gammaproteobacteria bacterium RIFCSPLOWO2_12_FULL_38_14]
MQEKAMRKLKYFFIFLFCVCLASNAEAKKKHHKHARKHRHCARGAVYDPLKGLTGPLGLQRVVEEMNRHAVSGVLVESLQTGQILYENAANQLFMPASNMKVITSFAALKFLGMEYVYHTRLMTENTATISQGVLNGNLYLEYEGDPSLKLSDLNALFRDLAEQGVHVIRGKFFVDTSRFVSERVSPGTELTDQQYCYAAPITTDILNRNCISFRILPSKIGSFARVQGPYDIPSPLENEVVTKGNRHCHVGFETLLDGNYILTGCVHPHSKKGVDLTVPLPPESHFGRDAAVTLLGRYGIQVKNEDIVSSDGMLQALAVHRSEPLSKLVFDMMKHSDNVIADALFKTVGALYYHRPASWKSSSDAVREILKQNSINTEGMQIRDGSGLSRENLVTPSQLLSVLVAAYRDPVISSLYVEALPASGLNGTLRRRLGTRDIIGKVKAKTGTMQGISSLSGFVEGHSGEMVVFSIIVNDFTGGLYAYHYLQDKLCQVVRASY